MAKYGLRWMDSDMHLCEPIDLWDKYMDRKFRDMAPRWTGDRGKHHLPGQSSGRLSSALGRQQKRPLLSGDGHNSRTTFLGFRALLDR